MVAIRLLQKTHSPTPGLSSEPASRTLIAFIHLEDLAGGKFLNLCHSMAEKSMYLDMMDGHTPFLRKYIWKLIKGTTED